MQPSLAFPGKPVRKSRFDPPATMEASRAARLSLTAELLGKQQQTILAAIRKAGEAGLTDEEGQAETGINPSSYRPRRGELADHGLIVASEYDARTRSGRRAVVWMARQEF